MHMPHLDLPEELSDRIKLGGIHEGGLGRLGNRLICVVDKEEGPAYLKIGAGIAGKDLLNESRRLEWIGNRLRVPKVLYYGSEKGCSYLLITELPGMPAHEAMEPITIATAVEKFAEGLKTIHSTPIEACPFDRVLENELEECARRIGQPGLNVDAFIADTGAEPAEILDKLISQVSILGDLVFTHGDYCLPNLLLDSECISGIVDWGIAGIGDRHRDFKSVELTLTRNCGKEWIPAFYNTYGEFEVDPERIHFFWLLDRFFSHYKDLGINTKGH